MEMSERAWWTSGFSQEMLEFIERRSQSDRKKRLFACACCRRIWYLLTVESRGAVELAERVADGQASESERAAALARVYSNDRAFLEDDARVAAAATLMPLLWEACDRACNCAAFAVASDGRNPKHELRAQADIIRDIFASALRPITFSPSWRTDTVVALAQQMYDSRDFGAIPILADALQDAGCNNKSILTHCRKVNGVHVHGCWVVDLVLEKE